MTKRIADCTARMTLITACLIAYATPAAATMTYDYTQRWMFDSDSGLYWQLLSIPTSTFLPSHGTIATYDQLNDLANHVGLTNLFDQYSPPAAYSFPLANLLSFFASNSPAQSPTLQPNLTLSALYDSRPSALPNSEQNFEYAHLTYDTAGTGASNWLFRGVTTIGSYGPGFPCPTFDEGCPLTELGFVVATVQPVPIPASVWLMMSGMGALAAFRRKMCRI